MSKFIPTVVGISGLIPKSISSALLFVVLFFIFLDLPFQTNTLVLGAETHPEEILSTSQPIHTTSRFETKFITDVTKLERKTEYKDDPETEAGEEKVLEEGADGKRTKIIEVTYYEGKEYERVTVSTEVIEPKDKIISKGTKIVWRTININGEEIRYWRKMRVWATHYDSRCLGCDEWTAIGMRQGKGVVAVDPKVIKLRSKFYVPGYGHAVAGDTGGAIKGNIIDLGFEDARTAGWSARFIDIYLQ
jgi:3D (Asp-Asp-Asp) domain-containing protein